MKTKVMVTRTNVLLPGGLQAAAFVVAVAELSTATPLVVSPTTP